MAGVQPFALTGANAKLRVNGVTLAFATNVSYRVEIEHEDPRVLGMYEGHSLEPVSYRVRGSFTVIRYVADIKSKVNAPSGISSKGNGAGYWGGDTFVDNLSARPSPREFFNPRLLDRQSPIEIEISQKIAGGGTLPAAKIRGAKITLADFQIGGKRSPAMQTFNFEALYADEDSFLAAFSGNGQQFS